jgi:hypothetical protein
MNPKQRETSRFTRGAKGKLNAIALRGIFAIGAIVWSFSGEFWIGMLAVILATTCCIVSGELR